MSTTHRLEITLSESEATHLPPIVVEAETITLVASHLDFARKYGRSSTFRVFAITDGEERLIHEENFVREEAGA